MERRLITGHSPYEAVAGFSRAVVVGDRVHVAGTAPIPADGSPPPESAYDQASLCLRIIGEALGRAGSGLEHVVRMTTYLKQGVDVTVFRERSRLPDDALPAATAVFVHSLVDPDYLMEVEVTAVVPTAGP